MKECRNKGREGGQGRRREEDGTGRIAKEKKRKGERNQAMQRGRETEREDEKVEEQKEERRKESVNDMNM